MTVWFLLESLREALEEEFRGFLLWNKEMELAPVNIFLQNLPAPVVNDTKTERIFPYITIRYAGSEDTAANEPGVASVIFIIGVYDTDNAYQGYRDAINVQEKIRQFLLRQSIVGERYTLEYPLKSIAFDDFGESTYPFFYGGIESKWRIPVMLQDMEGFM